jgi:hypothetical protein
MRFQGPSHGNTSNQTLNIIFLRDFVNIVILLCVVPLSVLFFIPVDTADTFQPDLLFIFFHFLCSSVGFQNKSEKNYRKALQMISI